MATKIALKRQAAGYYTALASGLRIEIEWQQTNYGDTGWMLLVNDEPMTSYPRETKREVVAIAQKMVEQVNSLLAA